MRETTRKQVARILLPVALVLRHCLGHQLGRQAMGSQLGTDMQRAISGCGAVAYQRMRKALFILPTGLTQLVHCRLGILTLDPACSQFPGQFQPRMFTPYQQAQGTLDRCLLHPAGTALWRGALILIIHHHLPLPARPGTG